MYLAVSALGCVGEVATDRLAHHPHKPGVQGAPVGDSAEITSRSVVTITAKREKYNR